MNTNELEALLNCVGQEEVCNEASHRYELRRALMHSADAQSDSDIFSRVFKSLGLFVGFGFGVTAFVFTIHMFAQIGNTQPALAIKPAQVEYSPNDFISESTQVPVEMFSDVVGMAAFSFVE